MATYRLYIDGKPVDTAPFTTLESAIEYVEDCYLYDKPDYDDIGFESDIRMSREERESWSYIDYNASEDSETTYTIVMQ